jgi:hypothetical protein
MEGATTQLVGRDGSPVRMSMRDVSPRRSFQPKKQQINVPETFETEYIERKTFDLVIPEKTVQKIMGPEPIPAIDIEFEEI